MDFSDEVENIISTNRKFVESYRLGAVVSMRTSQGKVIPVLQISLKAQDGMLVVVHCSPGPREAMLQVSASMKSRRAMMFRLKKASVFINYKVRI